MTSGVRGSVSSVADATYPTFAVAAVDASPVVGPEIVMTGGVVSGGGSSSQVIAEAAGTRTRVRNATKNDQVEILKWLVQKFPSEARDIIN